MAKDKEILSLYLNKKFDRSLRGYSHRELWSRTRWIAIIDYYGLKIRLHHRWQTPDNKLDISLPSGVIWRQVK
jgi:hypothetical protein